ncbi:MAG: (Fe-S)-binding protein [Candidatus Thiodiazotropha sp.]
MSEFGFGQGFEALQFGSFGGSSEENYGPYIPEARDCISCGVCTGSCPTFKVRPEENYGPRGRVRMIDRVINKQERLNEQELEALESCTLCRSCETVCPSKMAYSELYLKAVQLIDHQPSPNIATRLVLSQADGNTLKFYLADKLIRFYQWSGLRQLLNRLPFSPLKGGLRELESLLPLPYSPQAIADINTAKTTEKQGKVGLFTGCIANLLDSQTHSATISLLTQLGYEVQVLKNQTCCGATYAHNGDLEQAKTCAVQNLNAFATCELDAIIYNASGCGAFLSEYSTLLKDDETGDLLQEIPPSIDILEFLSTIKWPEGVELHELNRSIAVHEPCSQRNVLDNSPSLYSLLAKIPGLDITPLQGNEMCCGAGGTKMVTQPELAHPPRDEKVMALLESKADMLISSNLSCALHLASGIRQAGEDIEVIHPVVLLARQLT